MKKTCPICGKEVNNGDIVVALMMARFKPKETNYDLEVLAQTITGHVYCAEVKTECISPKNEEKQ